MEAAFEMVRQRLGDEVEALVVPHALLTLPIVEG
jgi:hypothetical protein